MPNIDYARWRRILLDTNTIIDFINGKQGGQDDRETFAVKLITDLSNPARKAEFFISFISLSEIHKRVDNAEKMRQVTSALAGSNVTFVAFDDAPAEFMADNYTDYLGNKALNDAAYRFHWQGNNLVNAREWINRDLMLIATAQGLGLDVILSSDVKTMYPLANEVGGFCAMAYQECFEVTPSYIHRYSEQDAAQLYEEKKPGPRPRGTGY